MIDNILLSRAKAAVLARDFHLATRLYKNLLKDNPEDVSLLIQIGNMYVKSGNDDKALPIFNQILSLESDNLIAMNNLGAIYRRRKEYESSVEILQKAKSVHGDNSQVEYNLGFTYKIMGEYDKAIQCFEDVIEANPTDVLAYNHIGSIYAQKEQNENAVQSYLRALKIDPNHPVLHLNLAKSYEKLKKYDEALVEYENALRTKPGWIEAIDGYADLLMTERKAKDAGALVMQAIRLNPEDAKMHSKLGSIFSKQGNTDGAIDEFSQALGIKADYTPALSGLASSFEKQGNFPAAIQTMERLESIKPNNAEVLKQFSGILLSADKTDEAKNKIDVLSKIAADDPHTLNLLGQYHICKGDFESAKQCFDKIEKLYPAFKEYLKDGAKRMKQKGVFDEAESLQKQYLALHPEDPEALSFLANLYEEQNKVSDALEFYQRSLDAFGDNIEYLNSVARLKNRIKTESAPVYDSLSDIDGGPSSIQDEQNAGESEDEYFDNEEAPAQEENVNIEDDKDEANDIESVYEESEEESSLKNLLEDNDKDIFASLQDETQNETKADTSLDESSLEDETLVEGKKEDINKDAEEEMQEPHSASEDVTKSIEDVVPLDDITDFDFSGMHHDLTPDENLAWSLHESEPIEAKGKLDISGKPDKTIAVVHINKGVSANIAPEWEKAAEEKAKFDYFNDFNDIAADDFSEAVDMTPLQQAKSAFKAQPASQAQTVSQSQTVSKGQTQSLPQTKAEPQAKDKNSTFTEQPEAVEKLFNKIQDLASFLPEDKKAKFLESKPRLSLDYVISKLHNEEGLFTLAQKKRNELGIADTQRSIAINSESVKNTLQCLISLSTNLSDKSLSVALSHEGEKLIAKL